MILYNITTQVSWPVHDRWKTWLTDTHLPAMLATGLFIRYQLVRLLEVDESEGPTYAIQLYLENDDMFKQFREQHLHVFSEAVQNTWGEEVFSFGSIMEVIN